jgi:hypothetical protein
MAGGVAQGIGPEFKLQSAKNQNIRKLMISLFLITVIAFPVLVTNHACASIAETMMVL